MEFVSNQINSSVFAMHNIEEHFTWKRMPVASIPINRGKLINDTKNPPKLAATVNTTKPKSRPPGAAVDPIIM